MVIERVAYEKVDVPTHRLDKLKGGDRMLKCEGNTIHLTRGDSAVLLLKIRKDDDTEYELQAGDSVLFTVKNSVYDTAVIIQKKLIDGAIKLTPSDTKNLQYGTFYYDVELTQTDGFVATVIGPQKLIIEPEVTY